MKRILIEFYSKRTPENLISLLNERFDGIVFLCFQNDASPTPAVQGRIREVSEKLLGLVPEFIQISSPTAEAVMACFLEFMDPENRYDFDITGGNEIFVASAGMFLATHPERKLYLHRYDVQSGAAVFRYPQTDGAEECYPRYLSVPQILALNGTPALSAPRLAFDYGPLKEEILRLWRAVSDATRDWNAFCSIPAETEGRALTQKSLGGKAAHHTAYGRIAKRLKEAGILINERETQKKSKRVMEFELSVAREALFLYEKAGNLLESYCALACHEAGIFHDLRIGVTADWNGTIEAPRRPDPRNEIDLVLMHRNLPILASCKNTVPINDYLYEISTMAKHYGGYFAKGVLFATEKASATVKERAKEMGITLIDGIKELSTKELAEKLTLHFA
ncbi:MAG: DUF1887 family protein [Clostridia bacterium]|nr:DUF1887 family protein [Clostridia bacterium]